jgi:hypothetical protein
MIKFKDIKFSFTDREAIFDILLNHEILDLSLRQLRDRWNWKSDYRVRELLKFLINKKTITYEEGKYSVNYIFKKVGREKKELPPNQEGKKKTEKQPPNPAYKPMMTLYFDWHENFIKEGKPIIQKQDGRGLNIIIKILESKIRDKKSDVNTEDLLEAFDIILQNYKLWTPFQQQQITLSRIATNLESIIINLKKVLINGQINSKNRTDYYNQIIRSAVSNL